MKIFALILILVCLVFFFLEEYLDETQFKNK